MPVDTSAPIRSGDVVVGSGADAALARRRRNRRRAIAERVVAVLAIIGGVATILGWVRPDPAPPVTAANSSVPVAQLVGSFAADFAETFFSAKTGDDKKLQAYITQRSVTLPSVAATVSDTRVVYLKQLTSQPHLQTWTTVVSLRINGTTNPSNERSFYRIPVSVYDGAPRALALPERVDSPPIGIDVQLAYSTSIDPGTELYALANGFLAAYLTGQEDLPRYTAANSTIATIVPPPYTAVTLTGVQADKPASDNEVVHLFVTAEVRTRTYSTTQLQYPITAVRASGRWQVQALDEQPLITPKLTAPPSARSPAGTPTPAPRTTTPAVR
ncbi:conjugal transfer protein [Aldersonia sp. NBC_00410]|uniref:conjugal transfer protein n=1 Tax=Aldersonia sp. NBC_00410 TaxID=2975954 RepID=UPI0022580190|nr:conjugal transfer protein [Aldersonia sp. NBC_00410]MCX5046259.1 conjugal transfer protein [Aldersonia sp. NBC_00410]